MTDLQRWLSIATLLAASSLAACRSAEAPQPPASDLSGVSAGSHTPSAPASAGPLGQKPNVTNRKIIRSAELELEVAAPGTTQTAIERLAEQHGGYVVSALRKTENGSAVDVSVTVTVRVPQAELMSTIAELKRFGRAVGSERKARGRGHGHVT